MIGITKEEPHEYLETPQFLYCPFTPFVYPPLKMILLITQTQYFFQTRLLQRNLLVIPYSCSKQIMYDIH